MYSALGPAVGIVILLADKMFHCFKHIHFYLHETPKPPHRKPDVIPGIIAVGGGGG